jgi:hypothetical protein
MQFGPGSEEIQVVGDSLWAVFEAGAVNRKRFYPLIARFDAKALLGLKPAPSGCTP